jgi:hypothetical protein
MEKFMLSNEGYDRLIDDIRKEFPDFRIIKKADSRFMKLINAFLRIASFGKMKTFMDSFITTIGTTVYVPDSWNSRSSSTKAITMRHERVHMRQARDLGSIAFSFLYLFFPLPFVFAYFRMKFEKEAYEESLRAAHEYYGTKLFTQALKDDVVQHFTSAEYMWMWPWKKSIEEWYDGVIKGITKK